MPRIQSAKVLTYSQRKDSVNHGKFDALCKWIEDHIEEPIGWQQLMQHSGLDYAVIRDLFYEHHRTTAQAWIKWLRESRSLQRKKARPQRTHDYVGSARQSARVAN